MLAAATATNESAPTAEEDVAGHAAATQKRRRYMIEAGTSEEAPKKEAAIIAANEASDKQPHEATVVQGPAILPHMDWPLVHKTINSVVREYMPNGTDGETIVVDRIMVEVCKRMGLTAEQHASVKGYNEGLHQGGIQM